jgi:hypothetical protein
LRKVRTVAVTGMLILGMTDLCSMCSNRAATRVNLLKVWENVIG